MDLNIYNIDKYYRENSNTQYYNRIPVNIQIITVALLKCVFQFRKFCRSNNANSAVQITIMACSPVFKRNVLALIQKMTFLCDIELYSLSCNEKCVTVYA